MGIELVIYIAAGGLLLFLGYISLKKYLQKRRNREAGGEEDKPTETVLARVYDTGKRAIYNKAIALKDAEQVKTDFGTLGRQWNRDGVWVYALALIDGVYEPMENYLDESRSNPPSDVHEAIHQPEISVTHDVRVESKLFEKYSWLIPWTIAIAFIIFMMVSGK